MRARQSRLPRTWLMTDERMGAALMPAVAALPRGAGVIFRHYEAADRRALYEAVRAIARARRLVLVLAGPPALAAAWRADGAHGPASLRRTARPLIRTMPVHTRRALVAARRADLRLVSPVFATRSHPGAAPLGRVRAGLMVTGERRRLAALGGMTAVRARSLRALGFGCWAAIDGLADQKRKAVPT